MNAEYWWQKNMPELSNSHRVIALDLRGHGLSGKTDESHRLDQYARDVRHLLGALELAEVTMVGWSMGTSIILSYLTSLERMRCGRSLSWSKAPGTSQRRTGSTRSEEVIIPRTWLRSTRTCALTALALPSAL
jgi:non-heme chloroperoxidase